jgi:Fic family protein
LNRCTQSALSDVLCYETEQQAGEPVDDIREVSNYVDAMMYGLERLEKLPLSLRLIREMYARLLHSGRGGNTDPGEFRRSQNWIGGSRPGNALFVPPPVPELDAALGALETFMHEGTYRLPPPHQGRAHPYAIRDDPPVSRWQWPHRAAPGHALPLCLRRN